MTKDQRIGVRIARKLGVDVPFDPRVKYREFYEACKWRPGDNTFVGYNAGVSNTAGQQNVFIGAQRPTTHDQSPAPRRPLC